MMRNFKIENVQVGVSKGGMACGPVEGHVIAEACVRDMEKGTAAYYCLAEVEGTIDFILTDESTFNGQIEEDYEDKEFWDKVSGSVIGGYCDYNEFYEAVEQHEISNDTALIWKYLAFMARADWDDIDKMKKLSIGKFFGEFDIPICDAEEDYLEEKKEEDR